MSPAAAHHFCACLTHHCSLCLFAACCLRAFALFSKGILTVPTGMEMVPTKEQALGTETEGMRKLKISKAAGSSEDDEAD